MRRAVFLDRDGVLTASLVVNGRPVAPRRLQDFRILPDARAALERLKAASYLLIVATNQPDVGNGLVDRSVVDKMHSRMQAELPIDDIEVCYSSRADGSPRRKPEPGMLLDAALRWEIDLRASFMVGDRWSDVEAGRRAGCVTVFIDRGYGERTPAIPDVHVHSLAGAVDAILARRCTSHASGTPPSRQADS